MEQNQNREPKQEYSELEVEVIRFEAVDIISQSNTETPITRG